MCVNDIGSLKSNDDVEECWVLDLRVQVGFWVFGCWLGDAEGVVGIWIWIRRVQVGGVHEKLSKECSY